LAIAIALAVVVTACSKSPGKDVTAPTTTAAPTTSTTEAPVTAGHVVSYYVPAVGDCYDKRAAGTPTAPTTIHLLLPCALPHQFEVYAAIDYPGADFPGTSTLETYAERSCVGQFQSYVGRPYETSVYDLSYELPTAANWGIGIRHVIGCLLTSADTDRLAGSARNTRR
jgi:hypothetical protein